MSEPFIGEIVMFGGNFAPRSWAFCDGQLLSIASNTALFSILGTTYGGDGRTTFGLPDMRGRFPIGPRNGPGLTSRRLGEKSGQETVTLTTAEMPSHSHPLSATTEVGNQSSPANNRLAVSNDGENNYSNSSLSSVNLAGASAVGGNQSHNNMPPFLGVNFIITLFGIYPSRS